MKRILIYIFFWSYSISDFSLTNNEINKICKKEISKILCIKRLKKNIYRLNQGNPIEIKVIPYRK